MRLSNVAYCVDFVVNLVSFQQLRKRDIYWDTERNVLYKKTNKGRRTICLIHQVDELPAFQRSDSSSKATLLITPIPRRRSGKPRSSSKGDAFIWHCRMGHPGPISLHKLGENSLGVTLLGPSTTQCEACSLAKMHRQISRRPGNRKVTKPFQELHIEWTDFDKAMDGFIRTMFITDKYTGLVIPYFMSTHGEESETLKILKDLMAWCKQRNLLIERIRSDLELNRKRTNKWLSSVGIEFEPSAPRTAAQNGVAERSGGVIVTKARAMSIGAKLPSDLWKEVIDASTYLHNRTPREAQSWKSPFETFYKTKPQLAHLKAYGCSAYTMTEDAQLHKNRRQKLQPRAYIGHLVGYRSTNIFRVWIPERHGVISTRDVIFDESRFYEGQLPEEGTSEVERETIINRIELPVAEAINEGILEEDVEILEYHNDEAEDISDVDRLDRPDKLIEDLRQAEEQERGLPTPPPDEDDELAMALHARLEIEDIHEASGSQCDFDDNIYINKEAPRIQTSELGAFAAGRFFSKFHKLNLPPPPKTIRNLEGHMFESHFIDAIREHLGEYEKMETFELVESKHTIRQQVLDCMWVFTYKTDSDGYLVKCKARLVVCGNQQEVGELPTRATTLASSAFRSMMA